MSLFQAFYPIPKETVCIVHAADLSIYDDHSFASVFASCIQPTEADWSLALAILRQLAEELLTMTCLDWLDRYKKYFLAESASVDNCWQVKEAQGFDVSRCASDWEG